MVRNRSAHIVLNVNIDINLTSPTYFVRYLTAARLDEFQKSLTYKINFVRVLNRTVPEYRHAPCDFGTLEGFHEFCVTQVENILTLSAARSIPKSR